MGLMASMGAGVQVGGIAGAFALAVTGATLGTVALAGGASFLIGEAMQTGLDRDY